MKGITKCVWFSIHIAEDIVVQQITFCQCHSPGEKNTHDPVRQRVNILSISFFKGLFRKQFLLKHLKRLRYITGLGDFSQLHTKAADEAWTSFHGTSCGIGEDIPVQKSHQLIGYATKGLSLENLIIFK
ncbi:hypothetical protein [Enterobacter kobei]|jgi:hypothetical protein|uniref:hypothetical protein n=1 Tax=Enterobacter kobei TaxID=208224 RepID=UPI002FD85538